MDDAKFQLATNEHMVRLALGTPHNSNCVNILKVSFPGNNIIKDMLRFGSWVYPSNLVNFLLLNNGVVNNELEFSAELKMKTITTHLTKNHDSLTLSKSRDHFQHDRS